MEKGDKSPGRWVEKRMERLEPSAGWQPDPGPALTRVREQDRDRRARRRRLALIVAGVFVVTGVLMSLPMCNAEACAIPAAHMATRWWDSIFHGSSGPPATGSQEVTTVPAYKVQGSPNAPVTLEVFTDYQCPGCAALFAEAVPMLMAEYVSTGKVKLVHRDFPLQMHPYSRLAARYANAAGEAGQYDLAVVQIFRTQQEWSRDGDIDRVLSQVLAPDVMAKVRSLVQSDTHLDDTVVADTAQGKADGLNQTPSVVIAAKGQRHLMAPVNYGLLKSYLDDLLK